MAQSLIAREEIRLAPLDGAAEIAAELIALQSGLRVRGTTGCKLRIEEIAGIKPVVAQVFVRFTVELFRAGASRDIDDRARIPAEFRAIRGVVDLEFRDGVDRRLERDLILRHITQVHAVDHEVDGILAATGAVECQCALSTDWRGQKAI